MASPVNKAVSSLEEDSRLPIHGSVNEEYVDPAHQFQVAVQTTGDNGWGKF